MYILYNIVLENNTKYILIEFCKFSVVLAMLLLQDKYYLVN